MALSYSENIILRNVALMNFALNLSVGAAEILAKSPCFVPQKAVLSKIQSKIQHKIQPTKTQIRVRQTPIKSSFSATLTNA